MGFFGRDESQDALKQQAFAQLSARYGLQYSGQFPHFNMTGYEGSHPLRFSQGQRGEHVENADGEKVPRTSWYCEVVLADRAWLQDLFVDEQHMLNRMVQFFGAQDVQLGNKEFDDAFTIKCSNVAYARSMLTPTAQTALLDVWRNKQPVKIINGTIWRSYGAVLEDVTEGEKMLQSVLWVARSLGR